MEAFKTRQSGYVIIFALGAVVAIVVMIRLTTNSPDSLMPFIAIFLTIVGLVMTLFHALHVEVNDEHVRASFGIGLISRTIPIERIRSVSSVRNSFIYGWGIRWIPRGWMFNISGFDAVELEFEGGRRFRIGTKEPEALQAAIEARLNRD